MKGSRAIRAPLALGLLPVAASAFVHRGTLSRYFTADDFLRLYEMANHGALEFVLTPYGGHLLLASNPVWLLARGLFGLEAAYYHALALATHLLVVYLLFRLIEAHAGRPVLAAFLAGLWGTSPVNQVFVAWFSVHCQMLLAALLLGLLLDLARVGRRGAPLSRARLGGWALLLLAASTSFGMGLGVGAVFPLAAWLLLWEHPQRARAVRAFVAVAALLPLLFVLQHCLYERLSGQEPVWLGPTALAPDRWADGLAMGLHLLAYGAAVSLLSPLLASDALSLQTLASGGRAGAVVGLLRGISVDTHMLLYFAVAGLFAGALALALARGGAARRRTLLAFLLLALVSYGTVVLGRGGSSQWFKAPAVWLSTAPRYHYVGPVLLVVLAGLVLSQVPVPPRRLLPVLQGLALAGLVALAPLCLPAAREIRGFAGSDARPEHDHFRRRIGQLVAEAAGNRVCIANRPFHGAGFVQWTERGTRFPGWAAVFVLTYPENTLGGKEIRFVERRPEILAAARRRAGSRIDELLVGPGECRPRGRRPGSGRPG